MRKLKKYELKRVYGAGNEDGEGSHECDDDTNDNDTFDSDKGPDRCVNH